MRIALTHPFCWPHVRRGTERNVSELAKYLVRQGHEVFTVSTAPDGPVVEHTDEGTRLLGRTFWRPFMRHARIHPTHIFFFSSIGRLVSLRADIVHSFCFSDAAAARLTRPVGGHRTVFQLNGVAVPGVSCRRFLPPEAPMYRAAIRGADGVIACSRFIGALIEEHYGRAADVITPPINMSVWPLGPGGGAGRPTFLSVADFTERRKGARPLVKAFARVLERVPDARLLLLGRVSPALQQELTASMNSTTRAAVAFLGLGKPGDVPRAYQEAHVTVLPSMWEPSGGVLLESWACGTPVVATCHGGIPEFFEPEVGVLFDPGGQSQEVQNIDGLADAMIQGFELAQRPETRAACRAHADRYSTESIGPVVERYYASL